MSNYGKELRIWKFDLEITRSVRVPDGFGESNHGGYQRARCKYYTIVARTRDMAKLILQDTFCFPGNTYDLVVYAEFPPEVIHAFSTESYSREAAADFVTCSNTSRERPVIHSVQA